MKKIKPVFIGGCERSGTTMLGAILGAHQESVCVPESQFKIDLLRNGKMSSYTDIENNVGELKRQLENHIRFRLWNTDESLIIKNVHTYQEFILKVVHLYAGKINKEDYRYWIDHTPANIQYVPTLLDLFPEAKFVHIVRDGRAVAASIIPLDWGPNVITSAANMWKSKLSYGLAAELKYGHDRIMQVRYEDLLQKPSEKIQEICNFIGMEYHESMIEGNGFEPPRYTKNQHSLVGSKPNQSRMEHWKRKLTEREVEIFEYLTGDLLTLLGYETIYGTSGRKITNKERIIYGAKEMIMFSMNRHRNRSKKLKSIERKDGQS